MFHFALLSLINLEGINMNQRRQTKMKKMCEVGQNCPNCNTGILYESEKGLSCNNSECSYTEHAETNGTVYKCFEPKYNQTKRWRLKSTKLRETR